MERVRAMGWIYYQCEETSVALEAGHTHEVIFVADALVEIQPCYAKLGRKEGVIESPQRRTCCVAHTWCAMARIAVCLPKYVGQALLLHRGQVRSKWSEVGSDVSFGHQIL
jgi:hypothetical protein